MIIDNLFIYIIDGYIVEFKRYLCDGIFDGWLAYIPEIGKNKLSVVEDSREKAFVVLKDVYWDQIGVCNV